MLLGALVTIDNDFLLPVVFGVILGTGVVYGLTAESIARWLGVAGPPTKGVALVRDGSWPVDAACLLQEAGGSVLVEVKASVGDAQADAQRTGIPIISVLDTTQNLIHARRDADFDVAEGAQPWDNTGRSNGEPVSSLSVAIARETFRGY